MAALRRADWRLGTLAEKLPLDEEALAEVAARYRLRIPHYYRQLIREPGDPIWRQCIPSPEELAESELPADPLAEDEPRHAPVPHLTHRYPDRALLLVTDSCPMLETVTHRCRPSFRASMNPAWSI